MIYNQNAVKKMLNKLEKIDLATIIIKLALTQVPVSKSHYLQHIMNNTCYKLTEAFI